MTLDSSEFHQSLKLVILRKNPCFLGENTGSQLLLWTLLEVNLEARVGIEPASTALQAAA